MPRKPVVVINPLFKLLLWINGALCVLSLIVMICLSVFGSDQLTKAQDRLLNACEHVFTVTTGAFIGLLGGRAGAPDSLNDGTELANQSSIAPTNPRAKSASPKMTPATPQPPGEKQVTPHEDQ